MIKTLFETETQTIEFNKTANLFINMGIVALHRYIKLYQLDNPNKFEVEQNHLTANTLTIACKELMPFLEEVYYFMGKEIYDISTKKQIAAADKYYFVKEPTFEGKRFAKMQTLGMAYLVTNDTTVARKGGKKIKFEALLKEDPSFAMEIANFLTSKGKKLKFFNLENGQLVKTDATGNKIENKGGDSEIFLYNSYTKTPGLEFHLKFLEKGTKICPITGEALNNLVKNSCTSPFGTVNHAQISWKAVLVSRFAPALCFYAYKNSRDSLICHFFNSNNLLNINKLYADNLFKTREELRENNFNTNFNLLGTKRISKNTEDKAENKDDSVWASEVAFMLMYTFYKNKLQASFNENTNAAADDLFGEIEKIPISLVSFQANNYNPTMRTIHYEEYNNVKFVLRLLNEWDKQQVDFIKVWNDLVFDTRPDTKPNEDFKTKEKLFKLNRYLRFQVFTNILKSKSIIPLFETLFFDCYKYLTASSNEDKGRRHASYKNYKSLFQFLTVYEQFIQFKNNNMDTNLQERAIKLGTSIGYAIINYQDGDERSNAKNGRKYIIGLHKSRTKVQFLEALTRIELKYGIIISQDILKGIDDSNFMFIKQLAVISTLNYLNPHLFSNNSK